METSRRCDICKIDVHLASYAKHLRSKRHSKNIRQDELVMPHGLRKSKHLLRKKSKM